MNGAGVWSVEMRDGSPPPRVVVWPLSPLGGGIDLGAIPEDATVLCWSGTLGEGLFARDWGTWGAAGWEALMLFCERVAPVLDERGARLVLRPHARHVLSDAFKCRRFLDENRHGRIGVALDAAAMMERSMLGDTEGHFERAFEMLGAVAELVIVTGLAPAEGEDDPPRRPPVPSEGAPGGMLGALISAHVPLGTPIVRKISGG